MLGFFFLLLSCSLGFACACAVARLLSDRLLNLAHSRQALSLDDILHDRMLCFLLFFAASLVVAHALSPWLLVPGTLLSLVLSMRAPAMLSARAKRRMRSACDEQIDVMADIMAMGVRSGLSFDASLELYCQKFDNDLSSKLEEARTQWTTGLASRQQALITLADSVGSKALRRFAETSLQSIHCGSPLAEMLNRFSRDIRRRRRCAVERQIEKAPVKMLIPTGVCILPAMLILVMGPVALQFIQSGT